MPTLIPFIPQENFEILPENALKLKVTNNNWKSQFPYSPIVNSTLWHNGNTLFINFEVEEDYVAALAQKDNDDVYKDSCVEFFISFDEEGYYNVEANCTGKILMSHRRGRKIDVEYANPEILSNIAREASLGTEPFECRTTDGKWYLTLAIPATSFFKHDFKNFNGLEAKCNIYKCGDNLPKPHFLSWKPINTENPDFHRPEFFGSILFAES